MFSRFARLPLRRCLHTAAPRATYGRFRFTAGVSVAVAASYLTWQMTTDSNRIALDSATQVSSIKHSNSPSSSLPPSPPPQSGETSPDTDPIHEELDSKTSSEDIPADDPSKTTENDESPDAGTGGAFNPVTGEINWDCPCLGGMAHGPCGPEFREAFSCFVFSEDEPKGINCVEKFKGMQTCFREHPEIYGDEIMDDDEDEQPSTATEGAVLVSSDEARKKQDDTAPQDMPNPQPAETAVQDRHSPASITS